MASKNSGPGLLILFNKIVGENLTLNQFYLLYCLHQGLAPSSLNVHQEIRSLITGDWVTENEGKYTLNPKSLSLITAVESYFSVQYKKSNMSIMGNDFEENAKKYNEIFPRMKLPSNKPARSPIKEVVAALREFFKEYDYTWDIVHAAAAYYIEEEQKKGFKYTRTSRYFIRKQDQDKTWISDLAGYCELVKNGEDGDNPKFIEKVF